MHQLEVYRMSNSIPLAVSLTGGNRNDVTQLLPLVDPNLHLAFLNLGCALICHRHLKGL
jgi:hypothetical protein